MKKINYLHALALISGALLPFAFAPFNVFPLAFLAIIPLLYVWLVSSSAQSFFLGWLFGLGYFSVGTTWVAVSIYQFGTHNLFLTVLISVLFVMILALFPATQGYVFNKLLLRVRLWKVCLLLFPSIWVIWEWLRSWVLTGFPWLLLGYSQLQTPLSGFAPVVGVYGVSFWVAMVSGLLFLLVINSQLRNRIIYLSIFLLIFFAGALLKNISWTHPSHLSPSSIRVSLIQSNISQWQKWSQLNLDRILSSFEKTTNQFWQSQIIVWPEGAVPTIIQNVRPWLGKMNHAAKIHQTTLLMGIFNYENNIITNSLLAIGKGKGLYQKRHLVPFGEYTPLSHIFLPLMKYFSIPMSNQKPGPTLQKPFLIDKHAIAGFICYEIAYPALALLSIKPVEMIVVINDDSWFGNSLARYQQLQIAQMRALESGRYLLYNSVTGITALLNEKGKIVQSLPINQFAVLTQNAQFMQGNTPLLKWNYYPLAVLILFLIIFSIKDRFFLFKNRRFNLFG